MTLVIIIAALCVAAIGMLVYVSVRRGQESVAASEALFKVVVAVPWPDSTVTVALKVHVEGSLLPLDAVALRFSQALRIITTSGVQCWSGVQFRQLADGSLHIVVHATPTWIDSWGRKVAGYADMSLTYNTIHVGSDLAALCHEMIEVMVGRFGLDGDMGIGKPDNWWLSDARLANALKTYAEALRA